MQQLIATSIGSRISNHLLPDTTAWRCKKRDGQTVTFDSSKVEAALRKCFAYMVEQRDWTPEVAESAIEKISRSVINVLAAQGNAAPEVEEIQRLVIQQLWAERLFDAAEHYQNYREKRRLRRQQQPISAATQARTEEMQQHFPTDLQVYQFMSKFSRWREEDSRRETWREACDRVLGWLGRQSGVVGRLTDAEWAELDFMMYSLRAGPAMRVVQMAGPALDRCNMGAFNCLTQETRFITNGGVRSFYDFSDGDETVVLTHAGQWRRAVVRNYGSGYVRDITFTRGRTRHVVSATDDHRWVLSNGMVATGIQVGDRLHRPPSLFNNWLYDAADPDEKLYWAYGFIYGNGTLVKKNGEYRSSMVRLCGKKSQYLERFLELGFKHSLPPSCNGEPVVYTGTYLKEAPSAQSTEHRLLLAFVRGYLDADGGVDPNWSKNGCNQFRGIQATGEEAVNFIRSVFPVVGVYINGEDDLTGQETNYAKRTSLTVRFYLMQDTGSSNNLSSFVVSDISEKSRSADLWCLEVEEDHSFVLPGGIVTGNCAYTPIEDLFGFSELLYILMQGTGCGFSVENNYVSELPRVKRQRGHKPETLIVEDDTEDWCNQFHIALQRWFDGYDVVMDVSRVRPKGVRLKTKGGRASGPGPYLELINFSRKIILERQGRCLEDIDVHDIACMTGRIVQVGGMRRAACISLSDLRSVAMREAKFGNWYAANKHRSMANNSAVYDGRPPIDVFMDEWLTLMKSGSGERGIFNRQAAEFSKPERRKSAHWGVNPCSEIILKTLGVCNLSIAVARYDDTVDTLRRKVRAATYFGVMQSTCTNFRYVRPEWRANAEEERLLGVDITGHADCPLLRYGAPDRASLLRLLGREVETVAKDLSRRFGINYSAANTCVKPSGDSAVFFNCGSGVSPWYDDLTMRWCREDGSSPVAQFLIESGVPHAPAPEAPESLMVFGFPRQAPPGATTRNDMTAIQQLENWLEWKENWAEHSVSATIYIGKDEWLEVAAWCYKHFDKLTGLAFQGKDDSIYAYQPNESLTPEQYRAAVERFPKLNWAKLAHYENPDGGVDGSQVFACHGGSCDLG